MRRTASEEATDALLGVSPPRAVEDGRVALDLQPRPVVGSDRQYYSSAR